MEKTIYNTKTGISYTLQGDYYLPDLSLPEEGQSIGVWGQRHARYLKQYHKALYMNLLIGGKMNRYLADIDKQAENMFFRAEKQLAEKEGITEKLKVENPMEWISSMNNICNRATEVVNTNVIFV